jgi:hypothetical protein
LTAGAGWSVRSVSSPGTHFGGVRAARILTRQVNDAGAQIVRDHPDRFGHLTSVRELTEAIRRFIDAYNEHARPFTWTKTADQVLAHARPARAEA